MNLQLTFAQAGQMLVTAPVIGVTAPAPTAGAPRVNGRCVGRRLAGGAGRGRLLGWRWPARAFAGSSAAVIAEASSASELNDHTEQHLLRAWA